MCSLTSTHQNPSSVLTHTYKPRFSMMMRVWCRVRCLDVSMYEKVCVCAQVRVTAIFLQIFRRNSLERTCAHARLSIFFLVCVRSLTTKRSYSCAKKNKLNATFSQMRHRTGRALVFMSRLSQCAVVWWWRCYYYCLRI